MHLEDLLAYLGDSIDVLMENMSPEEIAKQYKRDTDDPVHWRDLVTAVYYVRSRKGTQPLLIRRYQ